MQDNTKSNLEGLPAEVLDLVAGNLGAKDIAALNAVSKDLNTKTKENITLNTGTAQVANQYLSDYVKKYLSSYVKKGLNIEELINKIDVLGKEGFKAKLNLSNMVFRDCNVDDLKQILANDNVGSVGGLYLGSVGKDRVKKLLKNKKVKTAIVPYAQYQALNEGRKKKVVGVSVSNADLLNAGNTLKKDVYESLKNLKTADGKRLKVNFAVKFRHNKELFLQILNDFRLFYAFIDVNLIHANLTDADLAGADLAGADLTDANLTDADLIGAGILTRTNLTRTNLTGANLTDAILGPKQVQQIIESGTRKNEAGKTDLQGVILGGIFQDADLSNVDLTRTNLTIADLTRTNLTGADLTDAILGPKQVQQIIESGTRKNEAGKTDLQGVILRGIFQGADLSNVDLTRTNLTIADLAGVNLTGANLTGANLTGANLTGQFEALKNVDASSIVIDQKAIVSLVQNVEAKKHQEIEKHPLVAKFLELANFKIGKGNERVERGDNKSFSEVNGGGSDQPSASPKPFKPLDLQREGDKKSGKKYSLVEDSGQSGNENATKLYPVEPKSQGR
jgi:uncharacterized protein YjbI with pentapeptide repeats